MMRGIKSQSDTNLSNNTFLDLLTNFGPNIALKDESGDFVKYSSILDLCNTESFKRTQRRLTFCLIDNDLGGISGYLALLAGQSVPLMLNASIDESQLQQLIQRYKPKYLWSSEAKSETIQNASCLMRFRGYCLIELEGSEIKIHPSVSLLLTTSGSTGSPKFVKLSLKNILSNASSIAEYLGLGQDSIPITTMPPNYSYGLSIIHSHVFVGATIAVTNRTLFDKGFWHFIKESKATNFNGVPFHYDMLKKLKFSKMDLPNLSTLTQAGGRMDSKISIEIAELCRSSGRRFITMYGQTEASPRIAFLPPELLFTKPTSIGIPIPGGEIWLESDEGHIISNENVIGELVYKGPNVFLGYAKDYTDLGTEDEQSSILRTGDLAKRDKDGCYYIIGRLKRFIKLYGHRINLLDIEVKLLEFGYEVLCSGKDDLLEIFVLSSDAAEGVEIKRVASHFLKVSPKSIIIYGLSSFPRGESGKISYKKLSHESAVKLA
jgi:long-chain acyl-CoA synthetase